MTHAAGAGNREPLREGVVGFTGLGDQPTQVISPTHG